MEGNKFQTVELDVKALAADGKFVGDPEAVEVRVDGAPVKNLTGIEISAGLTGPTRVKLEFIACVKGQVQGEVQQAAPPAKPPFRKPSDAELEKRFTYHAPKGDQAQRYAAIRRECLLLAHLIRDLTPCSPEQTRALNAVDEASMLANAAIARNE
jgi:hypothetical protein